MSERLVPATDKNLADKPSSSGPAKTPARPVKVSNTPLKKPTKLLPVKPL